MSAPAAPLTPADITALLPEADGWQYSEDPWASADWRRSDALVSLGRDPIDGGWANLRISHNGKWRSIPVDSETEVRAALTFAGLIPGQVSVTQPRVWHEGDAQPANVEAVVDSEGNRWDCQGRLWVHRFRGHLPNYLPWDDLASVRGPLTEVVDR